VGGNITVTLTFMRLIICSIATIFIISACHGPKDPRLARERFNVTVQAFALTAGYNLKYQINEEGINIITNCDFEGCKPETKYRKNFGDRESNDFYQFLKSLRIDTLKTSYTRNGVLDGYLIKIFVEGTQLPVKHIELSNRQTKTTARLLNKVNDLVTEEKYRFGKWEE